MSPAERAIQKKTERDDRSPSELEAQKIAFALYMSDTFTQT